jgi:hypothetical protein
MFLSLWLLLGACSAKQDITRLVAPAPKNVCIVKHDAVREGVLKTIQEGFSSRNIHTTVVAGIYEQKHGLWQPRWYNDQVKNCDALCFYVANWTWDVTTYMHFTNIWMTSTDGSKRLAQATYDAGRVYGLNKFIVAKDKIRDLMNQMLTGVSGLSPVSTQPATDASVRLQKLDAE